MTKPTYITPEWIVDALDTITSDGLVRTTDPRADETFIHCLVCGEWEGHTDDCPMPAIERWQKNG